MSVPRGGAEGMARSGAERGFTLLEVLIVMAILGLIAGLIGPRIGGGVAGLELPATAREVAGGLRAARADALRSGRSVALVLDPTTGIYRVDGTDRRGSLPRGIAFEVTAVAERDAVGSAVFRFFPDGSATGGRVSLVSGERRLSIRVDWMTGRVNLVE